MYRKTDDPGMSKEVKDFFVKKFRNVEKVRRLAATKGGSLDVVKKVELKPVVSEAVPKHKF